MVVSPPEHVKVGCSVIGKFLRVELMKYQDVCDMIREEFPDRNVGDLECEPGKLFGYFRLQLIKPSIVEDEPLLKESKRRFVLFPIQYHEVRSSFS